MDYAKKKGFLKKLLTRGVQVFEELAYTVVTLIRPQHERNRQPVP